MTRVLMKGSHAIAEAAIQAGCRFYAGYPITPSTEILEYMSHRLPQVGGVCMNAESELEAINMVWGAAGCGVRAMIASTGQGISLMQESFAELANAEIPCVIVNMMRGQGDYYQATRGGGHGDYRHLVLAPHNVCDPVGTEGQLAPGGGDAELQGARALQRLRRFLGPGPGRRASAHRSARWMLHPA